MSTAISTAFVAAEVPIVSAAFLAVIGYIARRIITARDQERADDKERDRARDEAIAALTQATAVLVERHDATRDALETIRHDGRRQFDLVSSRLDRGDRAISTLRETTAILSAMLERSDRWHPDPPDSSIASGM